MAVIGIDFGGTKIEGILMNKKGKVLKKIRLPTEAEKPRAVTLKNLVSGICFLKNSKTKKLGIGTPGFYHNGKLKGIHNVPTLIGFNLKKYLTKETGLEVVIENDANCFALAENRFGAGKGTKHMIGIILGTGVGGGLIIDGNVYRGANGASGEIGHHIINPNGPNMKSSFKGDFETYCSGTGILYRYKKYGGKKDILPSEIFKASDRISIRVVNETIKYLGIGLANMINIFNPEAIILGGGVSNINFIPAVKNEIKKHVILESYRSVKIKKNKLGDSSGVIGAAALVC